MASGPITSWVIDGETVSDFIYLGSKITADGDCSHEIKRCLLLGARTRLMGTHGDGPCPQARHGALCAAGVSQRLVTGRAPVEEEASVALEALGERRGQRAAHCCFQERTRTLGCQFQQNLPAWRPWRGLILQRVWRWGPVWERCHCL